MWMSELGLFAAVMMTLQIHVTVTDKLMMCWSWLFFLNDRMRSNAVS